MPVGIRGAGAMVHDGSAAAHREDGVAIGCVSPNYLYAVWCGSRAAPGYRACWLAARHQLPYHGASQRTTRSENDVQRLGLLQQDGINMTRGLSMGQSGHLFLDGTVDIPQVRAEREGVVARARLEKFVELELLAQRDS